MDQNRTLSGAAYDVENGSVKANEKLKGTDYIVLDTVDTNKDVLV